jgi:hypothetical protein
MAAFCFAAVAKDVGSVSEAAFNYCKFPFNYHISSFIGRTVTNVVSL